LGIIAAQSAAIIPQILFLPATGGGAATGSKYWWRRRENAGSKVASQVWKMKNVQEIPFSTLSIMVIQRCLDQINPLARN
jgi:hypothetical protein